MSEEDSSGTGHSHKRSFLSKMGVPARYEWPVARSAEAPLACGPVDPTVPRAEGAVLENRFRFVRLLGQFNGKQSKIGG